MAIKITSERAWLDFVRRVAQTQGWRTYHTHDSRRSEPGFPDLVLVRKDRLLVAELKTATGVLSKEQQAWLDALAECGAPETVVWRPVDLPCVLGTLGMRGELPS